MPQRHIALFDAHIPKNIKLAPTFEWIRKYSPTHLIIGGDWLNCEWASHWNTDLFKTIGWAKVNDLLNKEILAAKRALNVLVDCVGDCKKYFIPGNHENFLTFCAINYPGRISGVYLESLGKSVGFRTDLAKHSHKGLADMLDRLLDLKSMGFQVFPYNENLRIGNITYLHGHQFSSTAAMMKKYPAQNIVAGHLHTHDVKTIHNSGIKGHANQYVSVPALCQPLPGFLNDFSTRWLNGFWAADVLSSGLFDGRVIKVLNGSPIVRP